MLVKYDTKKSRKFNRILLLLFLLISSNAFCQDSFTISGYVTDSTSLEPLVGAHIIANGSVNRFTTSNANGYYQLQLKESPIELVFSFSGARSVIVQIEKMKDSIINVSLPPATLDEVVVFGDQKYYQTINAASIPIQQIKKIPSLGGEADVLKALTLMPGVSPGIEGATGINVRGGSPDQNLILLDEAPVYMYPIFLVLCLFLIRTQ